MAKAVEAGKAYVSLGLKPNMKKGLQAAGKQMKAMGKSLAVGGAAIGAAGAAVLLPLLRATSDFAKMGDEIHKMSARTGVAKSTLSELAFAAEQSGAGVNDVEKSFKGLSSAIYDAAQGSKMPADAFEQIGVSFTDLAKLSPEEQFMKVAEALSGVEDMSLRGAIAQKVFGRTGRLMLPMLEDGAAGINKLRQEARDLGRGMSGEDADAAAAYTDAMNRVASVWKGIKQQVGAALAPALAEIATKFAHMAKHIVSFIRENKTVIKTVAAVAMAVIGFGAAITALGFTFIGIGAALSAMAGLLGFILSPLGAIIVTLAAVGIAAEHYFGFFSKAIDYVIERFGPLVDMWGDAFTAIVEAMTQGDLEGAWALVMDGLEGTFLDLTSSIGAYWDTAMNVLVDATAAAAEGVGAIMKQLGEWLQNILKGYKDYYNDVYNSVTEMIGEMSGVRTIGGPVDAFGSTGGGDFMVAGAKWMSSFGEAMEEGAEGWRQDNQRNIEEREKARKARRDEIRKDMSEKARAAEDAKAQRKAEMDKLKRHDDALLGEDEVASKGLAGRGTFSIAAAEAMAGGTNSIQQQQLQAQKKTVKNTDIIAKNTLNMNNGMVFA